jgi:nitrate reductase delta subunit
MSAKELFKFISLLLQYPDKEICEIDISSELANINDKQIVNNLQKFEEYFVSMNQVDLQKKYVETFDFNDETNLFLTYSKLKDEKERGQVLVELKNMYAKEGMYLDNEELPDYLPLFLEFISVANDEAALDLLHRFKEMIKYMHKKLLEAKSPYAYLIKALLLDIDHYISKGDLL